MSKSTCRFYNYHSGLGSLRLFVIFRSIPKLVTTWISFSFDMEIGIPRFHQISKTCKLYELHKIMSLDGDTQGQVLMYIEKQGKE